MSKISDFISKRISSTVEIEEGLTLSFGKINLRIIKELQDQGIEITNLGKESSLDTIATIAWELLTPVSKALFDSKNEFLELLDIETQTKVVESLNKAFGTNSDKGAETKSEKK